MKINKIKPSPYTQYSEKVIDIFDVFDRLRYRVYLNANDLIEDEKYDVVYQITVVDLFTADGEPIEILTIPEYGKPDITDYNEAIKLFTKYVQLYENLIRAETRDCQSIEVFKEKFEYEVTCPECCDTCKFAKYPHYNHNRCYNPLANLECTNPKNQFTYNEEETCHEYCHEHQIPHHDNKPIHKEHINYIFKINPKVARYGHCKNYEKREHSEDDKHKHKPHHLEPPWVRPYHDMHHCKNHDCCNKDC